MDKHCMEFLDKLADRPAINPHGERVMHDAVVLGGELLKKIEQYRCIEPIFEAKLAMYTRHAKELTAMINRHIAENPDYTVSATHIAASSELSELLGEIKAYQHVLEIVRKLVG